AVQQALGMAGHAHWSVVTAVTIALAPLAGLVAHGPSRLGGRLVGQSGPPPRAPLLLAPPPPSPRPPARPPASLHLSSLPPPPARENRPAHEKTPPRPHHGTNPSHGSPGGAGAFARARAEEKPIFLSIGYSTCHWCHVMERESFTDDEVGAALNADFVAIKVDREERPDVDRIYMTAMQALGQGGGWPLNVVLTPTLEPFSCG